MRRRRTAPLDLFCDEREVSCIAVGFCAYDLSCLLGIWSISGSGVVAWYIIYTTDFPLSRFAVVALCYNYLLIQLMTVPVIDECSISIG